LLNIAAEKKTVLEIFKKRRLHAFLQTPENVESLQERGTNKKILTF